ncbi:microtubule-associated protein 70-2, partial [Phtheirospermum japonicum]
NRETITIQKLIPNTHTHTPRTSFSRRVSSTRTGSEPCINVMMSSISEPFRDIGDAAGFLLILTELGDVSLCGSASPLL